MNLIHISLRNVRVRLLSTALTTLSIAMGTALMATMWLMIAEAEKKFRTSIEAYTMVVGPNSGSSLDLVLNTVFNLGISEGVVPYSVYHDLHDGQGRDSLRMKGLVVYAIPQARGDNYRGMPVIGTTDEMFSLFYTRKEGDEKVHLRFAQGEPFAFGHEDLEEFVATALENDATDDGHVPDRWRRAVIGDQVSRRLGLTAGDRFVPNHGPVEEITADAHDEAECVVAGVLERTGSALDRSIFVPMSMFFAIGKHKDNLVRPGQEQISDNIGLSAIIVRTAVLTGAQKLRYEFQSWPDAQGALTFNEVLKLLEIIGNTTAILEVISYIVLLVAASTVLLALYNTMNERRREIAIMRALGARRGQISGIILAEALLISLCAGVLGVLICHGTVFVLQEYIEGKAGMSVDWLAFSSKELFLILGVGALGSVAGILPALKAARVPVTENLGPTS